MIPFLTRGGIFAFAVLLVGALATGACITHLLLAIRRPGPDAGGLALGGIGVTLGLGVLGAAVGFLQVAQVLPSAGPHQRVALGLEGVSVSLYPLVLALGIAVVQVALETLARTIRANRREGSR